MGATRNLYTISVKKPIRRTYLKNLDIDGRIIFRTNFKIYDMMVLTILCRSAYFD